MSLPQEGFDEFKQDGCADNHVWTGGPEQTVAHWHKYLLGKNCCGQQTGGRCWDSRHSSCAWYGCMCPCHEHMNETLRKFREALRL